jgi:subtilisin family serine protease
MWVGLPASAAIAVALPAWGENRREGHVSRAQVTEVSSNSKLDSLLDRFVREREREALVPVGQTVQSLIRTETFTDGQLAAAVFVKTSNLSATRAVFAGAGGYVRVEAGDIVVGVIPVGALRDLAASEGTVSVEASQYSRTQLDVSRTAANADLVQDGSGLSSPRTGAGVIVGVIDSGIDYTRADFQNGDGTTRLRSIWDISGVVSGGSPRICSAADIDASVCTERDVDGHGTHVASTAAGNGRLQAGFIGIAPGAEIIAAKATRSTLAKGTFAEDDVVAAANYIFQQAQSAGRPAVINMSIGGFGLSPLDGTSAYEQALSNLTGPGKIIVASAGNSGSSRAHLSYPVTGSSFSDSLETNWIPAADGSEGLTVLWYGGGNISVGIAARTSSSQSTGIPITPAFGPGQTSGESLVDLKDDSGVVVAQYLIDASTTSNPGNGAHAVGILLKPVQARYFSIYTFGTGTFDGWTNQSWVFGSRNDSYWRAGDSMKTIGTPGTARKVIAAGAFTTKKQWSDVNGVNQTFSSYCASTAFEVIGDIACFSSRGPTRDGRIKPDLVAPGHRIAAALSVNSIPNHGPTDRMLGGKLLMESGTSMAAPHITGVVALLLQGNPLLTFDTALAALQSSATKDAFTGGAMNNTWGAGKVNALEAVKAAGGGLGPSVCTEDATTMCLVGGRYRLQSHWKNQYAGGAVATLSKARLTDVAGAFWIQNASAYEYLLRISTGTDNGRAWIAIPTFTDVEFWIDVTDTRTGQSKQYHSPAGNRTLIFDPSYFVFP